MNKTININIGGRIFSIEEGAYIILDEYLKSLKAYFSTRESGEEILADIESRIAELFLERVSDSKQVILTADVEEIISIMGSPQDYMDAEEEEEIGTGEEKTRYRRQKRFYRDPDDKLIFGVCGGISAYFGWDPLFLRAFFVITTIFYGFGPIVYIILALIIPKATTTAEKLRMRGEPVTVDNISKKVRESFKGMKDDIDEFGKRNKFRKDDIHRAGRKTGDFFTDLFEGLGRLLQLLLIFIVKIIGVLFFVVGVLGIFFLVAAAFGLDDLIRFGYDGIGMEDQVSLWLDATFTSGTQQTLFFIGAALVLAVPVIGFLLAGLRLLFNYRRISGIAAVILVVIFFVGLGFLAAVGINTSRDFIVETTITERYTPPPIPSDTLIVDVADQDRFSQNVRVRFDDADIFYSGSVTFPGIKSTNILYLGENRFTIEEFPANGNEFQLKTERSARGGTQKRAVTNAEKIKSNHSFNGDTLRIFPYFALEKGAKIRDQELLYILSVPVGKSVYFTRESDEILYDVPNVTNTYDSKMIGHHWLMTDRGLVCTDCPPSYTEEDDD